ncbi:MAG: hypothetical protein M1818_007712 [Claussenomyces sp. TS43310]|nr:MAG: hypothetical protein M1818_007712 [Claussenomyces sp. TS43310]
MSSSTPAAAITSLDHLVLTVASIEDSVSWYSQHLGMKHESFVSAATPDVKRHSLLFGQQKINLHQSGKVVAFFTVKVAADHGLQSQEFEPKARNVQPGSADLCFLTSYSVSEVRTKLIAGGVNMVDLGGEKSDQGIVMRTGAKGKLKSVYCRDPDGNLIE